MTAADITCKEPGCSALYDIGGYCFMHYKRQKRARARRQPRLTPPPLPSRDDCPVCNSRRDELGRLPIGLCGPDCTMARAK